MIPETLDQNGSVFDMWKSGARGSLSQITQMAGMKGLIQNSAGETIEFPVLSSSKEGLTPIEYFTTTHGSRKGLTDTALNTAKAGYLTRKLFSVAQDVITSESDCGTSRHVVIKHDSESGIDIPLAKKIRGRVLAKATGDFKKGHLVTKADAEAMEAAGITEVPVFSPMTCQARQGVCSKCYGLDLGKGGRVDVGESVGTVAAQAIGEPGTQLTMRTFHAGGTASVGGDITQGLPRVEELFERRKPKSPALIAHIDGTVGEIITEGKERIITLIPEGGSKAKKAKRDTEYSCPAVRTPLVKVGDEVKKGQFMTDGSADLQELFKYGGTERTQEYIIGQVNKIYELQGEAVARKHIEIMIRQMFSRVQITHGGDTRFSAGEVVERVEVEAVNEETTGEKATFDDLVLGITEVALTKDSFLAAASFQHTNKVLIASAVRGAVDTLDGLKENVILGRLIPAGTGFEGSKKHEGAAAIEAEIQERLAADEEA